MSKQLNVLWAWAEEYTAEERLMLAAFPGFDLKIKNRREVLAALLTHQCAIENQVRSAPATSRGTQVVEPPISDLELGLSGRNLAIRHSPRAVDWWFSLMVPPSTWEFTSMHLPQVSATQAGVADILREKPPVTLDDLEALDRRLFWAIQEIFASPDLWIIAQNWRVFAQSCNANTSSIFDHLHPCPYLIPEELSGLQALLMAMRSQWKKDRENAYPLSKIMGETILNAASVSSVNGADSGSIQQQQVKRKWHLYWAASNRSLASPLHREASIAEKQAGLIGALHTKFEVSPWDAATLLEIFFDASLTASEIIGALRIYGKQFPKDVIPQGHPDLRSMLHIQKGKQISDTELISLLRTMIREECPLLRIPEGDSDKGLNE